MTTDRRFKLSPSDHLAMRPAPSATPHFHGIVREEHDLVEMFGEDYRARNDNARRRQSNKTLGEEN